MFDLPPLDDVICAIVRQCGPDATLSDIEIVLAFSDLSPSPATIRSRVLRLIESGRLIERSGVLIAPDPELYEIKPPATVE